MALKLNGKDARLNAQDFLALARTIGLAAGEAAAGLAGLLARLSKRAATLSLPELAGQSKAARIAQDKVIGIVAERSEALMDTQS